MTLPMTKRVVLLTGATSGIGREVARGLALQGATLVVACRNQVRAAGLAAELRAACGAAQIATMPLELAELRSVRAFAADFLARYQQLHVLINNAGTFCLQRQTTEDGLERTLGVNYVAPFLLTHTLLPLLSATPGARIVNIGSEAYRYGRLDLEDLQLTRRYAGFMAYASSKQAQLLWSLELADRLRSTGVTVNVVHPGHVATGIWQLWTAPTWYQRLFVRIITSVMRSPAEAARGAIYLASSPNVAHVTGGYFLNEHPQPQSIMAPANDLKLRHALWAATERMVGGS
ncbi:SDR family NAD(P)-dependent oxidoreductase [Candidatus Viridilinea mediisalina]|uniref:Short-chain dehydrogenase n=1 Tax=Candidatus Viridilinea mediisalina TaxID=2024553 RepID=A0A2A6RPI8_9CHLR|nr:SDR family NAD(P)-dependent oxidoreductase [Candidatus Viridilinea mediisalina]PDW04789.1 hypothetical protein CJ255_01730 [Candidatus Viridilinea mediisalina]